MSEIRVPTQKRAILKKESILKAGYKLFTTIGYYKTDTAKIAKEAGVSTGIVYSYFKDKKQILIECSKLTIKNCLVPLYDCIFKITPKNYQEYITSLVDMLINYHLEVSVLHNDLQSILASDEELKLLYSKTIEDVVHQISEYMISNGFNKEHIHERIHLAILIIEEISHEVAFSINPCIDKESMKSEGIKLIEILLNK